MSSFAKTYNSCLTNHGPEGDEVFNSRSGLNAVKRYCSLP